MIRTTIVLDKASAERLHELATEAAKDPARWGFDPPPAHSRSPRSWLIRELLKREAARLGKGTQ